MSGRGKAVAGSKRWSGKAALAALLMAQLGLGACSVPQWADPTDWFAEDTAEPAAKPAGGSAATDERFPNLGRVPPRPVEQTAAGDRSRVIGSLSADRDNARYTDEELRARPAQSNTLPPSPQPPSTPLAAAAPARASAPGIQGTAVPAQQMQQLAQRQPAQAAASQPALRAAASAAPPAPFAAPAADNQQLAQVYTANLQASSATVLPANLAQQASASPTAIGFTSGAAASRELLAIVRFAGTGTNIDQRDRSLIHQTLEFQRGVNSGKGRLRVVSYADSAQPAAAALAERRAQAVLAEMAKQRFDTAQVAVETRASAGERRVEIFIEN